MNKPRIVFETRDMYMTSRDKTDTDSEIILYWTLDQGGEFYVPIGPESTGDNSDALYGSRDHIDAVIANRRKVIKTAEDEAWYQKCAEEDAAARDKR